MVGGCAFVAGALAESEHTTRIFTPAGGLVDAVICSAGYAPDSHHVLLGLHHHHQQIVPAVHVTPAARRDTITSQKVT